MEQVWTLTQQYDMLPRDGLVLCAVSGGADSMCLLHLLCSRAGKGRYHVAAAHYNHQLRGGESNDDEAFVAAWCAAHDIPCFVGHGDVRGEAALRGKGTEETAREMRYAFLRRTAEEQGAVRIATAHQADDNAETVLLHLVRGCGLQGLTGIPPRRGEIVRPLLTTTRAAVLDYLREKQVPYREDSTNSDLTYTRNRLRHQVMPLLREMNPRFAQCAGKTAAHLRADNDYLTAQAMEPFRSVQWTEGNAAISVSVLNALPEPVSVRVIRLILRACGDGADTDCTAAQLGGILRLCKAERPSAKIFLNNSRLVRRVYDTIIFMNVPCGQTEAETFPQTALCCDGETVLHAVGWRVTCRAAIAPPESEQGVCYISRDTLRGPPVLRPRQTGDAITLPNRPRKTLKKLMIDEKVPRYLRESIPVLADENSVLALAGFGADMHCIAPVGTDAYRVAFLHMPEGSDFEAGE
ncbi:MAG: tRNA lysidine(34) synthetase TilS [Oscillospiraceae bacterium]|nr:tRNA lysidine(34) synthetase TilS [Oscillospiraceae bacterium]